MKIILTHGYFLEEDEKEKLIMKPYVPLGILYISAYLEQHGLDNDVVDNTFSSFSKFKNILLESKPDVIGIYTNLMTKINVLRIIQFIRTEPRLTNTKIILGGPEVRNHASKFLGHGADVIVIGEGEETMLQVIRRFERGEEIKDVKGIAFKKQDGTFVTKEDQPLLKSMDELPFPNRKKIDLQAYFDAWKNAHGSSTISLSTMRGCPYACKWCSRAVYGGTYRRRSPKLVVDEIVSLQAHYHFDHIWFVDDVFTINLKWLRQFAEEIKARNIKVNYEIITRADRMNEEVIDLLKESGCFRIWIGAESGSQEVIDAMDRRVDVQQVREMIRLTRKKGLQAGTFIMLGYPGETQKDIRETIHHLNDSNPDFYTITLAYPIKGTPLYSETENQFLTELEWETSTDRDIDFKRTYPRRYYDFALRWVYNEVAFQKQLKAGNYMKLPVLKMKSWGAETGMMLQRLWK